jgi:hypothetical protein
MTMKITDFAVESHGTIWVFEPLTDAARAHAKEHFPEDAPTLGLGYVVEHRYADAIIGSLLHNGLGVELDGNPIELRTLH